MPEDDKSGDGKLRDDKAADGNARQNIDPRFDPVFQRGYRGEARTPAGSIDRRRERMRERQPKREDAAVSDAVPSPQRERPDAYLYMPTIRSAAEAATVDHAAPTADDAANLAEDFERPMMPPSRINPYIVALWIIGIGLLAAGVLAQCWAVTSQVNGGFSSQNGVPIRVVLISLANTVSGPMITVGIATIVGLIFMLATKNLHTPASRVDAP